MLQQALIFDYALGEIDPKLRGRFDLPLYAHGASKVENANINLQGGFSNRQGTIYLGTGKAQCRLIPFVITPNLGYVLEFTVNTIRIWKDGVQLLDEGSPLEIPTTYSLADIADIQYTQDGERIALVHPSHAPAMLVYNGADSFTYSAITFTGNTGEIPFQEAGDYPTACAFHEGRLWLAASLNEPGKIWASKPFDYSNFYFYDILSYTSTQLRDPAMVFSGTGANGTPNITAIAAADTAKMKAGDSITGTGVPTDTKIQTVNPTAIVLNKNLTAGGTTYTKGWANPLYPEYEQVTSTRDVITTGSAIEIEVDDSVIWLASGRDLIVGCSRGERIIAAGSAPPIVPARKHTAVGSATIQPVFFGTAVLFPEGSAEGIREYSYSEPEAAYHAPALTYTSGHIMAGGITEIDFQQAPVPVLWAVRADGQLIGCVYSKGNQVQAWQRFTFGTGLVESIAVVAEQGYDTLYLSIKRGSTRYIERLGLYNMTEGHLDCCSTKAVSAGNITGIPLPDGSAQVVYNSTLYNITVASGTAAKPTAVPNGVNVLVGYSFTMTVTSLPLPGQSRIGTAHMRPKMPAKVIARVDSSKPFKAGNLVTQLDTASFTGSFTGDVVIPIRSQWDTEGEVSIVQDTAQDLTVLALQIELDAGG